MNFDIKTQSLLQASSTATDALIVLLTDTWKPGTDALSKTIALAIKEGDLIFSSPKAPKVVGFYRPSGLTLKRLVLVPVDVASAQSVSAGMQAAAAVLKGGNLTHVQVHAAPGLTLDTLRAAALAIAESSYVFTTTKPKATARTLKTVVFSAPKTEGLLAAVGHAQALVAGIEFAKEWANRPANHATPTHLGQAAKELVKAAKNKLLTCEVLGPKEVEKLAMGSFMAVAQGSDQPLRFIVLRYEGAAKSIAPTVLIGKGITFDSGGISIKPAPEMDEMKFDMCGAASVLGTFKSLSLLKPKINVIGLIPSCENLLNGKAVKPGDVVTSMSGQTIEVLNTDAEGRLILCDALTYSERFKPQAVIDIATLTGACVVALGAVRSGMFSNNEALAKSLMTAGEASGDLCWRMPLDDEYGEGLKSNFADMGNIAGRAAGAVTAAKFLQRFVGKMSWAHLDIAGTAWKSGAAKGATGRPVGLLLAYLLAQN